MSSRTAVLVGAQKPRVEWVPRAVTSDADDAVFLAAAYGLVPDAWQEYVLAGWLGRRRDGKWSSPRCGLSVPRQNGKNSVLEVRELFGMIVLGEKFLHTAHEVKTARKSFARLLHFFDNPRHYPELAELVQEIRRTNGQEAILLTNGGSVEFIARSKGSGRGFTVDVLVFDEAQELSDDKLAALLPTISAAPLGNPQTIFTGTPPSPLMNGEVFTRVRKAGLSQKDKRLCWHEWSCPPGSDLNERAAWAISNPGLGKRLSYEATEDERAAMDDATFGRERGGMWDEDDDAFRVIPSRAWSALADRSPDPAGHVGRIVLAVDADPDRAWATIVAAGARSAGPPLLEITSDEALTVDNRPGVDWAEARVIEICGRNDVAAVVIDKASAANSLVVALTEAKIPVVTTETRQMTAACGQFYDAAVETKDLTHLDDPLLLTALKAAVKRKVGDAWAWDKRKSTDDITPLVAATLALWGHSTGVGVVKNAGKGRVVARR